ncbi:MAG: hypothetical protein QM657_10730 [Lacrimispora sp.]|uniref:hypothetical protein n=1 Tax=Lacrimispora sp. TaxID=2719234 RepID=UPI0039E42F17
MSYYNKAVKNEPEITAHIKQIAAQLGVEATGLQYRVKSKDSYLIKIRRKYDPSGNQYEVKDILRYTYTDAPEYLVNKTLDALDKHKQLGYNTIEVKNYWLDKLSPYNGINTVLRAPNGQAFEIQYHTTESFNVKNGKMHELYEKQRLIKDTSSKGYIDLDDEMFELSDSMVVPNGIERVKDYG